MLENLDALERAYQNSWVLSTSQLEELLGISAKTISRQERIDRHGFALTRSGQVGSELGWIVTKVKSSRKAR